MSAHSTAAVETVSAQEKRNRSPSVLKTGSFLTLLVSILFWSYVGLHSLFIGFPVAVCLRLLHVFYDTHRRELQHWWTYVWAYHYHHWNPFCSTTLLGRERLLPLKGKAVIYVCNHQSTTDIMLLYAINTHFKWVSKSSNFYIPLIGWNMSFNDYVPVKRGNKDSVVKMFDHCKRHLAHNNPLVFFPEGSRSTDGNIKDFKPGAFSLAIEQGVPIVPLVLDGTSDCLTAGKGTHVAVYNGGGWDITLKVLEAIDPATFGTDADALAQRVRGLMTHELLEIQGAKAKKRQ